MEDLDHIEEDLVDIGRCAECGDYKDLDAMQFANGRLLCNHCAQFEPKREE